MTQAPHPGPHARSLVMHKPSRVAPLAPSSLGTPFCLPGSRLASSPPGSRLRLRCCVRDSCRSPHLFLRPRGISQVLHAQHRVLIDQWIDLKISPRIAVLFKGLRNQIFELMRRRIDNSAPTGPEATADEPSGAPPTGEGPLCSYSAQSTVLDAVVDMIKQGTAAAELNPDANKEKALATASGTKTAAGSKSGRGSGSKGNGRGGGRR